jgi:hypothetical protein
MAMIMEDVDLVWNLKTEVTWWLVGEGEGGEGDNTSRSWRVFSRTNLGRPSSIFEGRSERQKLRSVEEVGGSNEMAGRETRKGSAAGGGGRR